MRSCSLDLKRGLSNLDAINQQLDELKTGLDNETQRLFRPLNTAQADIRNFAFDIKHPDATVWQTYGLSS